jgi:hypothetical protein
MPNRIQCYVEPLGRPAPEGLEAVELFVCREFESIVQKPLPEERIAIVLETKAGVYTAGLRTYPPNGQAYICPDLISDDGTKVSMAKVLKELGIESRVRLNVLVDDGKWEIPAV